MIALSGTFKARDSCDHSQSAADAAEQWRNRDLSTKPDATDLR
jgi:hypothetical protein